MEQEQQSNTVAPSRTGHPTIATIAGHLGLSRATVTHVMNGRGTEQRISPATQQRVLEAAQELGYRANASARAVRAGRFGSIALIQSHLGQYLPPELLFGLTTAIAARDLNLILNEVANVDASGESYVEQTMRRLSVDGVLVNRHAASPPPFLDQLRNLHIPAIFLNSKQDFDCIYPDELEGGRLATAFLMGLGHERIAYVETEPRCRPHFSEAERRTGYELAMRAAGKAPCVHRLPTDWRTPGDVSVDQRVQAARKLLARPDRPTAVVAYEMTESMAIVRAAHLLGLRIPMDLSLMHFHHCLDDGCFIPIHTISNKMREVGEGAVAMLIEKMEAPGQDLPARIVAETLIEGATCMPPCHQPAHR